jgi:hypothetical protein
VSRSAGPAHAAATPAGTRTFRGENHLQQLLWIFEEIFEFVARRAEHLVRKLRRNLDARNRGILRHVADLVDLDAGLTGQRGFQLFRQR